MTKVACTIAVRNCNRMHAVADIGVLDHVCRIYRPGEARPTGVAIEFVNRSEKRLARNDVHVDAGLMVIPVGVRKWLFRSVTLSHTILLGRKARYSVWVFVVCRHLLTPFFDAFLQKRSSLAAPNTTCNRSQ